MKYGVPIAISATLLGFAMISLAPPDPSADADHDGIPNAVDKCVLDSRYAAATCDTDHDGYGNPCDADFDQDGRVLQKDYSDFFAPSFKSGAPSSRGTDMD